MDVNKSFQRDFKDVEVLVRAIYPEITDRDISLLKQVCKGMVGNIIHEIGNSVNALTHTVEINNIQ